VLNIFISYSSRIAAMILSLFVYREISSTYDLQSLDLINFYLFYLLTCISLLDLGLNALINKMIMQKSYEINEIIAYKIVVSIPILIIIVFIFWILYHSKLQLNFIMVIIISLIAFLTSVLNSIMIYLRTKDKHISSSILSLHYGVATLIASYNSVTIIGFFAILLVLSFPVFLICFKPLRIGDANITKSMMVKYWSFHKLFFIPGLIENISGRLDSLIIANSTMTGQLTALNNSQRLSGFVATLSGSIGQVLTPSIISAGTKKSKQWYLRLVIVLQVISIFIYYIGDFAFIHAYQLIFDEQSLDIASTIFPYLFGAACITFTTSVSLSTFLLFSKETYTRVLSYLFTIIRVLSFTTGYLYLGFEGIAIAAFINACLQHIGTHLAAFMAMQEMDVRNTLSLLISPILVGLSVFGLKI
jgi:O-antigen/teichoic acid export membrane protein